MKKDWKVQKNLQWSRPSSVVNFSEKLYFERLSDRDVRPNMGSFIFLALILSYLWSCLFVISQTIQKGVAADMPVEFGNIPICKDNLNGLCKRSKCKWEPFDSFLTYPDSWLVKSLVQAMLLKISQSIQWTTNLYSIDKNPLLLTHSVPRSSLGIVCHLKCCFTITDGDLQREPSQPTPC